MNVFKDLYKYRELLRTSVKKEIRGKYKGAWLGVLWSYLNPILMLMVYSFVFTNIMKIQIENYSMFLFTALIPWTFFVTSISQGSLSTVANGSLMKKVYFPREIIPISSVTANAINFLISILIVLVSLVLFGVGLSYYVLLFPLVLLVQYILILGITFITSSFTVYARDLEHIISVALMALFYATPIVYSLDMIPSQYKFIMNLNPMASIIQSYRDILFYKRLPNFETLGIVVLISVVVLIIGYFVFKRFERNFVEEL